MDLPQIDTTPRPRPAAPRKAGQPQWIPGVFGLIVAGIAMATWMAVGPSIMAGNAAAELEEQYQLLVDSNADQMDLAMRSGAVAECYLHAKDKDGYRKWKAISEKHMRAAGIPALR